MDNGFFDAAQGGDVGWFQHVAWFFGQPKTWFFILILLPIFFVVFKVSRKLFKSRRIYWMFFFLAAFAALTYLYIDLFHKGIELWSAGRGDEAYQIRIANWIIVFMSFASAVWLIFERSRKPK